MLETCLEKLQLEGTKANDYIEFDLVDEQLLNLDLLNVCVGDGTKAYDTTIRYKSSVFVDRSHWYFIFLIKKLEMLNYKLFRYFVLSTYTFSIFSKPKRTE